MHANEDKLASLRTELRNRHLDGFVVPLADEHMSDYVGAYAKRLRWLTGFTGTAGVAVVLCTEAAVFVDGRYDLQVREQVDGQQWSFQKIAETSVASWLQSHAPDNGRIGYDPWLHPPSWVESVKTALSARGIELVPQNSNPVDTIWTDRPKRPTEKISVYPLELAGESARDKIRDIVTWLGTKSADACLLSSLESIAWTFNIRGYDVPRTPVTLAFALVNKDGSTDLFLRPEKLTDEVTRHLSDCSVLIHESEKFSEHLNLLSQKRVTVDPDRTVAAIIDILNAAGAQIVRIREPAVVRKATKNITEVMGHRTCQVRDGVALTRFLHWLSLEAPKHTVTELSAAAKLLAFRQESGALLDLSFDTISAFGSNGAIVHYRPTDQTNKPLVSGSLFLIDSGAQYLEGTTDVTRTVAIGQPTIEMRDRFTRVLKGHIALARALFPAGTTGRKLDTVPRLPLWEAGLDYAHGTGHGVGCYLSVHEGPQKIGSTTAFAGGFDEPILPGMIVSNEPGYYKAGCYGIRTENLMLVVKRDVAQADNETYGFEILTWAPLDRSLIDINLLTPEEREWIDSYHANVAKVLSPHIDEQGARNWLLQNTYALS